MTARKSKERRAFERKLARLAKSLWNVANDASGMAGDARDLGLRDEQVGAVMIAVEAALKASARMASAVRDMDERVVESTDADRPAVSQDLALAKYVSGVGYVLNGRVVG